MRRKDRGLEAGTRKRPLLLGSGVRSWRTSATDHEYQGLLLASQSQGAPARLCGD